MTVHSVHDCVYLCISVYMCIITHHVKLQKKNCNTNNNMAALFGSSSSPPAPDYDNGVLRRVGDFVYSRFAVAKAIMKDNELTDDDLVVFEQALQNPRASVVLNDWLDKKLDDKLSMLDAKWEQRFKESDAKWEQRFKELDAKWEQRFKELDAKWELRFEKLDEKLDLVALLKEQNQSQAERLTKLQELCDAKNEEIISILRKCSSVQ